MQKKKVDNKKLKNMFCIFRGARQTRDTPRSVHMHSTQEREREREAVMTDDGSQSPTEQLATAVHRGSATRSWCGPLLLVCACNVDVLYVLSDF